MTSYYLILVLTMKYIDKKHRKMERNRLAEECVILAPTFEKAMAEEGISEELNDLFYNSSYPSWLNLGDVTDENRKKFLRNNLVFQNSSNVGGHTYDHI